MLRQTPAQYELKRVNRFVLEFPAELGFESWQVQTSGRPKYTVNPVVISYMNTESYVAGKYKWEPISITFIDTIAQSASQKTMEWVRTQSESLSGRQGYAIGYLKNIVLKALDPTGVEVEKWTLVQCMITESGFGENDHGNDGLQMVTITVQPQYCLLEA